MGGQDNINGPKQNETMDSGLNKIGATDVNFTNTNNALNTSQIRVQNVDSLDVNDLKVYGWGKKLPSIDRNAVVSGINNLKQPYNSEVSELVKSGKIKELQIYLNSKISENVIDAQNLKKALRTKGISFSNNKILEDGKFGPQTLETLKFLIGENDDKSPIDGSRSVDNIIAGPIDNIDKKGGWTNWIEEEISDEIKDIKNSKPNKNFSKERNVGGFYGDSHCHVDLDHKLVGIATRGTKEYSQCASEKVDTENRCELDWNTGKMYAYAKGLKYELPFNVGSFTLDKNGNPNGADNNNRERIQLFARIGNLVNFLKNKAVFNGKGAIEYNTGANPTNAMLKGAAAPIVAPFLPTGGAMALAAGSEVLKGKSGICLRNGLIRISDTRLITDNKLDELSTKYQHILGNSIGKEDRIKLASLLTAMKFDLNKISWKDVEKSLDDTHKQYVATYIKKNSL